LSAKKNACSVISCLFLRILSEDAWSDVIDWLQWAEGVGFRMSERAVKLPIYTLVMLALMFVGLGIACAVAFGRIQGLEARIVDLQSEMEDMNRTIQILQNRTSGSGGLSLRIEAKASVHKEETTGVNITLTNDGIQVVKLTFPTSKQFDLVVLDSARQTVYRWSQDKVFLTVLTQIELQPGESTTRTLTWSCNLSDGDYVMVGLVEAYNVTVSCSKPFTVEG
jgi:hypothetical protein